MCKIIYSIINPEHPIVAVRSAPFLYLCSFSFNLSLALSVCLSFSDTYMHGCMDAYIHGYVDAQVHECMDS